MAYLRDEKKKSGTYLRIVQGSRNDLGKVEQKTLYSLGKKEDYTDEMLQNIGKKFYTLGNGRLEDLLGLKVVETGRFNYGFFLIYNHLFKFYELDKLLDKIGKKHGLSYRLSDVVLLMLMERLCEPASKLSNFQTQEEYLGLQTIELQHFYRSLNYLYKYRDDIQELIFKKDRSLFNQPLEVVFYDVTTFYFESEVENEGKLRQKGFSKDGKIGNTQVLMGLLIDKHKHPISYQLFKGDTFEGHTLKAAVEKLRQKYHIQKVIFVADRGMLSRGNLKIITETPGFHYIIGERLKSLPLEAQSELLKHENYTKTYVAEADSGIVIKYHSITYEDRLVVGTWSKKRAEKDRKEREIRLRKGEALRKNPSLIDAKARRFFLKKDKKNEYEIDKMKVEKAEKYDGYLAIATDVKDMQVCDILAHYKHLFQVEHSFRTMKSHLETRPMFHWTDERIEGHFCLCYIAYALNIQLINRLKLMHTPLTERQIRKSLSEMQASLVQQGKNEFYMRSKSTNCIENILKAVKTKNIPDLIPKTHINNYL